MSAEVWTNGRRYAGQWKNAKMHGRGCYTFATGCVYEGEYRDDLKSGKGVFTWPDGHQYEGEWRGGRQHGSGTMTWPARGGAPAKAESGKWVNGRRIMEGAPYMSPEPSVAGSMTGRTREARGDGSETKSVVSPSQTGETGSFHSVLEVLDDPEVGIESAVRRTPGADAPGAGAQEGSWRLLSRLFPRSSAA
ncbi:unnamed protein product [Prorocentrum cordatum]|uniref:MORN repeat-containing protein 5 n=1 Tax=Prorocentrum cordatum TaxID=2364126 RepID=A0ABN9WJJ2_9DINO|nr:unnamed protein product [Polarella glacialis]